MNTEQHACFGRKKVILKICVALTGRYLNSKQQWAIRKWAKATMQMVLFAKFKGRSVNKLAVNEAEGVAKKNEEKTH